MSRIDIAFLSVFTAILFTFLGFLIPIALSLDDLGAIKEDTGKIADKIGEMASDISEVKKNTEDIDKEIGEMASDMRIILDRTRNLPGQVQVTPEEGGRLTSWSGQFKAIVPPGAVADDLILSHESRSVEMLPGLEPEEIILADGSILTPYRFGELLLDFVFAEPIRIYMTYTEEDLELAEDILENLVIQYYDKSLNLWLPLDTRAKPDEMVVFADTWEPGWFILTARAW